MTTYDLGDAVNLRHLVRDRNGQLVDATVAVTLVKPDGTTDAPAVVRENQGTYVATVVPDQLRDWAGVWHVTGPVTSVAPFAFTVADPAPPLYAPFDLVKRSINKLTADDRDDLIEQAARAACRLIDRRTGRRFSADRVATTRVFSPAGRSLTAHGVTTLLVDDIAGVEGLTVSYGSAAGGWTALAGWETGPDNAIAYGRPIKSLSIPGLGYVAGARVQVTARWGWPAVPDEIVQASLLLAARLYRRKDSPQGVLGNAEWGVARVSRLDPDVEALLAPFMSLAIA